MVCIIDYKCGNSGSIMNMLSRLGEEAVLSNDPSIISDADKLILPGVGNFDYGMRNLNEAGLISLLQESVFEKRKPILGICLGAQIMTKSSEEGTLPGLGWFDAEVKKFHFAVENPVQRIPHMGWNQANVVRENKLVNTSAETSKFYFVHSYYIETNKSEDIILKTMYGFEFVSGLQNNNLYAVQFHPEKSHKYGLELFKNFLAI